MRKKILFLCTQNSARSQMAEAIVNSKASDIFIGYSAGSSPAEKINPYAIEAMKEVGIDISKHKTKSVLEFIGEDFDFIITLCDKMKNECPSFSNDAIRVHWGISDPRDFNGNHEETIKYFKRVRNEISNRINLLLSLPMEKLDKASLSEKIEGVI